LTDYLKHIVSNSQNPKNIKISFVLFMAIDLLLERLETNNLTQDELLILMHVTSEMGKKKDSIRERQAYNGIVNATTSAEKQAAFENYQNTKQLK